MTLSYLDLTIFVGFIVFVVGVSLWASRGEESSEDYFLAGRSLTWWIIGVSLIASNISTEQLVGMAGSGFGNVGLAVAAYEWVAGIAMVVIAFTLLPVFLRSGIYTMPEFLEYRYNSATRTFMACAMMIMYVVVMLASVLYSGAITMRTIFGLPLEYGVWMLGVIAGIYTVYGGLKAVAWSDLIQGLALLGGAALILFLGIEKVGGWESFFTENRAKLHTILPADHPDLPWTSLCFGIWIPVTFYWGLNQFIVQRTLASKSLANGQNGLVLAAAIKLVLPFLIIFPGIIAAQLYGAELKSQDEAFPTLIKNILPEGLRGVMFAAIFGAVMSTLDSLLNSASTIFTVDIYKRIIRPDGTPHHFVTVGRITTAIFVVTSCLLAPMLDNPAFGGIFKYIQMFQGFVSPGILAVFLVGLLVPKAPPAAALTAMTLNILVYGALLYFLPTMAFLNHMGITFVTVVLAMLAITAVAPLSEPRVLPRQGNLDLTPSRPALFFGGLIVMATIAVYAYFR